jgi:endonuclease
VILTKPSSEAEASALDQVLGSTDDPGNSDADELVEAAFALEYQLRDFIADNLHTINVVGRQLKVYVDSSGRRGIEYPSEVGPIDILAVDETGSFYVFELKRARSPDHAIGQLTRYMGWVRKTIGAGREVAGCIVAKAISNNLRYAVSVIPNVSLFEYEVEFRLKIANEVAMHSAK